MDGGIEKEINSSNNELKSVSAFLCKQLTNDRAIILNLSPDKTNVECHLWTMVPSLALNKDGSNLPFYNSCVGNYLAFDKSHLSHLFLVSGKNGTWIRVAFPLH